VFVDEALHGSDHALERDDHLVHRQALGFARQAVAAVGAACALDEPGAAQQRHDALEIGEGEVVALRDRLERDRRRDATFGSCPAKLDEQPDSVFGLRREDHRD
jgi:hypothetical protein